MAWGNDRKAQYIYPYRNPVTRSRTDLSSRESKGEMWESMSWCAPTLTPSQPGSSLVRDHMIIMNAKERFLETIFSGNIRKRERMSKQIKHEMHWKYLNKENYFSHAVKILYLISQSIVNVLSLKSLIFNVRKLHDVTILLNQSKNIIDINI